MARTVCALCYILMYSIYASSCNGDSAGIASVQRLIFLNYSRIPVIDITNLEYVCVKPIST